MRHSPSIDDDNPSITKNEKEKNQTRPELAVTSKSEQDSTTPGVGLDPKQSGEKRSLIESSRTRHSPMFSSTDEASIATQPLVSADLLKSPDKESSDSDDSDAIQATPEPVNHTRRYMSSENSRTNTAARRSLMGSMNKAKPTAPAHSVNAPHTNTAKSSPPNPLSASGSTGSTRSGRPVAEMPSGRGASNVFKNVEICFMTQLAAKAGGGDAVRREVSRVFRAAGGTIVDDVFQMSLEFNVVSVCVVDPELDRRQGGDFKKDYNRNYQCSSVAVLSKQWIFESLRTGKLLPFRKFLMHEATCESLKKSDYPEHLST